MLLVVGYFAWQAWGAEHVARKYYGIEADAIQVTTPPEYIRSNIIAAVYEDTAMESMSLMDRQACAKVGSAFGSHPWVRRVVGVQKLPGGILDVRLEYREPVAMVDVISRHSDAGNVGCYAVDGEGVLLPSTDFAEADTMKFLHVVIPGAYPTGRLGTPFGDTRITAAAMLAKLLHPHREKLNLRSIGIHGDSRNNPVTQLQIADADGGLYYWGSPPGVEYPGEFPAMIKLQSLLDGAPPGSDLRQATILR